MFDVELCLHGFFDVFDAQHELPGCFFHRERPNHQRCSFRFRPIYPHSLVGKNLTELGYKPISFESDYPWVEIPNANIYYRSISARSMLSDFLTPSDFDTELSATTLQTSLAMQTLFPIR